MSQLLTLAAVFAKLPHHDGVNEFLRHYGALALFTLVLLQDVGVPTGLPGTVLVLIGGYLVFTHTISYGAAVSAIAVGAFLGASGMFFLARYGGRPLVLKLGRFVGLTEARLDLAAGALDRWGPPMLLITRVAPGTRVYMTIFAGVSGWTYRRFALWTGIFVVLWALVFVAVGAALGPAWVGVARYVERFSFILLFAVLALVLLYYGLRLLLNHASTRDSGFARVAGNGLAAVRLRGMFVAPAPAAVAVAAATAEASPDDLAKQMAASAPSDLITSDLATSDPLSSGADDVPAT
jgi:membrane protein DedA with SNARE-associated domain